MTMLTSKSIMGRGLCLAVDEVFIIFSHITFIESYRSESLFYERLIARFSNASILASIGGCDENNAITPFLSLIPEAAICSGSRQAMGL